MVRDDASRAYWAVVVGGGGLAMGILWRLAELGFGLCICVRSQAKGERLRRRLNEANLSTKAMRIHIVELELSDFASIRLAVEEIESKHMMVKLLVNAAGIYSPEKGLKSASGLDYGYAVNFVGPVLFMQMLHPLLRAHTPSLVINVTCQEYGNCKELDLPYIRRMQEVARKEGRLRVFVENCRDLPSSGGQGMATIFVKLSVAGQEHSTNVHKGTIHPLIHETVEFVVSSDKMMDETVLLEVFDAGSKDGIVKVIGRCRIPLSGLVAANVASLDMSLDGTFTLELPSTETKPGDSMDQMTRKLADLQNAILTGRGTQEFHDLKIVNVSGINQELEEANFHVRQLGLESDLVVQVDEKQNRVIFRVMKRLNMLQTSKRQIIVDVKRRLLCNQTIHGRTRKQFPMEQIEQIICNPKHQQKVTVKFIKNDLLRNGIVVATGNQRDYELTFATEIMRHQFIKSMEFFLNSTVKYDSGKISFVVLKRLNALKVARRIMILDLHARKLYNVDDEHVTRTKSVAENRAQDMAMKDIGSGLLAGKADLRKTFNFVDITSFLDKQDNPNTLSVKFRGGQRPYHIEFMTQQQKTTFRRLMLAFMVQTRTADSRMKLRIDYTRPQSKLNAYQHQVNVKVQVPTRDGGQANWIGKEDINVPKPPAWFSRQWDRSKGSVPFADLEGAPERGMNPTECCRHAKMCLVAYTMEAARRSADISARKGVQFHVVDPGFMKTSYYHTALGLGSARRWKRWQAKRFGADPYKVAGFIEMIVRSEVFEHVNGLYVKCVKEKAIIVNLGPNTNEPIKLPPKGGANPQHLKKHRVEATAKKCEHPVAAVYDIIAVKQLWESHVALTGFDPESAQHTFLLNMAS